MNRQCYFSCNFTDSTFRGANFVSTNLGTKFRGNEMKKHYIGLYLDNTAVIDTQSHAGNLWTGAYNSTYGAWNENDSLIQNLRASLFIVNPSLGAFYNPNIPLGINPGEPNDQGWFEPDSAGHFFECIGYTLCTNSPIERGEGSDDLKEAIATNSAITTDYIPESKMIAQMDLYKELKEDSVLRSTKVIFENFVNDKETESIGYLYETKSKLKELDSYLIQQLLSLNISDSLINLYRNDIIAIDSLAATDSSMNNIQARENLVNNLAAAKISKENILNQVNVTNIAKINEATNFNSFVVAKGLPDENMKFINGINSIYLLYGRDTLNYYYQTILALAIQCPQAGGKAVYEARALISMLNDTVVYDDDNVCLQQGYYRISGSQNTNTSNSKNNVIIIPNPANNYTDVILQKDAEGICVIEITDIFSKQIFTKVFDCSKKQYRINTSKIAQGIYNVQIKLDDAFVNTKLVIVK